MGEELTPYVRPTYRHMIGTAVTKDDRVLLIMCPDEFVDRATWIAVRGIDLPPKFAVLEFMPDAGREVESTHVVEYEFAVPPEHDTVRLRSALITGLGKYTPSSADFRALRPEDNRERALEYFERADWSASIPLPGWDFGGPAPTAKAFPSTRAASRYDLQLVADIYVANIDKKPAEAVEAELGVSRSTADRRIREARDAGLITAVASRGRKPKR